MLPGHTRIVTCPFCGAKKELMSLRSGNTFGARFWSDGKRIAPMLPQVSPVQKCLDCGKYYLLYQQKSEFGEGYSSERGELDYFEWKEAYSQLSKEETTKSDLVNVRLNLIQAYNDYYYRSGDDCEPPEEESRFIATIIVEFIKLFNWRKVEIPLLKAELYREIGEMKKCARVLSSIENKPMKDLEKVLFKGIKERMEKGDCMVFRLNK